MELKLDLDSERRLYEAGIRPSAEIGLLLLSRLERAEARVKILESGIVSELVVTSVHSASAIGTTVSGISEDLLKLGYDGLTERLEQAEKNADTYQTLYEQRAESLEQAEQAVARVREVHRPIGIEPSETICHECSTSRGTGENLRYFPYTEYPCMTILALDSVTRG